MNMTPHLPPNGGRSIRDYVNVKDSRVHPTLEASYRTREYMIGLLNLHSVM